MHRLVIADAYYAGGARFLSSTVGMQEKECALNMAVEQPHIVRLGFISSLLMQLASS